jgi:BCD family chlorophyll transporter-like MFS transporter
MRKPGTPVELSFQQAWQLFCEGPNTLRRLLAVGLGTMAFTMEDVLLEPYGGEILGLSVSTTTMLTATLASGGLIGFAWASRVLARGTCAYRMASWGARVGVPAFVCVIAAAPLASVPVFSLGIFLIGLGGGLQPGPQPALPSQPVPAVGDRPRHLPGPRRGHRDRDRRQLPSCPRPGTRLRLPLIP